MSHLAAILGQYRKEEKKTNFPFKSTRGTITLLLNEINKI